MTITRLDFSFVACHAVNMFLYSYIKNNQKEITINGE